MKSLLCCIRYGISPENIILYGQSIGTVPTVDLASRYECAAVVLHSPLTSGMRVAFPDTKKTYCFDAFPKSVNTENIFLFMTKMLTLVFRILGYIKTICCSRSCVNMELNCGAVIGVLISIICLGLQTWLIHSELRAVRFHEEEKCNSLSL